MASVPSDDVVSRVGMAGEEEMRGAAVAVETTEYTLTISIMTCGLPQLTLRGDVARYAERLGHAQVLCPYCRHSSVH